MTRVVNEPELIEAARSLARDLPRGAVVWLVGELGAGKTTFARVLLRARGAGEATSPTFSLVHRHEGPRGAIHHVDCYRLRDPAEAGDLDWEAMESGDLLVIEWPERGEGWVPPPHVTVTLGHCADPDRRALEISGERRGPR